MQPEEDITSQGFKKLQLMSFFGQYLYLEFLGTAVKDKTVRHSVCLCSK